MLIAARNAMLAGGGSQPSGGYWGLCFTAEQANSTVAMTRSNANARAVTMLYSTNPADPTSWAEFAVDVTTVTLANIGDKVWIKAGPGGNGGFGLSNNSRNVFSLSGLLAASGSVMSLLNGEEETFDLSGNNYQFKWLFLDCKALTSAPDLPATVLSNECYRNMFRGCTGLTSAPFLPAQPRGHVNCYSYMFYNCSSLNSIRTSQTTFSTETYSETSNWVSNVAATGTFYCPTVLGTNETIRRGTAACPTGWTVVNTDA